MIHPIIINTNGKVEHQNQYYQHLVMKASSAIFHAALKQRNLDFEQYARSMFAEYERDMKSQSISKELADQLIEQNK